MGQDQEFQLYDAGLSNIKIEKGDKMWQPSDEELNTAICAIRGWPDISYMQCARAASDATLEALKKEGYYCEPSNIRIGGWMVCIPDKGE